MCVLNSDSRLRYANKAFASAYVVMCRNYAALGVSIGRCFREVYFTLNKNLI